MASKSAQQEPEKAEVIEELLDVLDTTLDRLKVLYEQYFLGIQKQPPTHLHTDVERKLRELSQHPIRNTALRYRLATLQQKFGSYNTYWRRTLRQIENGTYHRNLSKIGRQAVRTGEDVPEEILAAMPKRMREQVRRDRDAALALAKRREQVADDELLTLAPEGDDPAAAFISESPELRRTVAAATAPSTSHVSVAFTTPAVAKGSPSNVHRIDERDAEVDFDEYFESVNDEEVDMGSLETPEDAASVRAGLIAGTARPKRPSLTMPRSATPTARRPAAVTTRPESTSPGGPPAGRPVVPMPAKPGASGGGPPGAPSSGAPSSGAPSSGAPSSGAPSSGAPSSGAPSRPEQQPRAESSRSRIPTAPSQFTRPIPITPGAAAAHSPVDVETMAGPFPRETMPPPVMPRIPAPPSIPPATAPTPAEPPVNAAPSEPAADLAAAPKPKRPLYATPPRPTQRPPLQPDAIKRARDSEAPLRPPPGMTDADVNALYAKYVKAKEMVGESTGPGTYRKLLKTINAQAPKIMEQYKAAGVDFSIVVKDKQVIIRAKPKP